MIDYLYNALHCKIVSTQFDPNHTFEFSKHIFQNVEAYEKQLRNKSLSETELFWIPEISCYIFFSLSLSLNLQKKLIKIFRGAFRTQANIYDGTIYKQASF